MECLELPLLTHKACPNKEVEWRNCSMRVSTVLNQSSDLGAKIDELLC